MGLQFLQCALICYNPLKLDPLEGCHILLGSINLLGTGDHLVNDRPNLEQ